MSVDIIIETKFHITDQQVIGKIIIKLRPLEGVESREHVDHLELVLLIELMLHYDDATNLCMLDQLLHNLPL